MGFFLQQIEVKIFDRFHASSESKSVSLDIHSSERKKKLIGKYVVGGRILRQCGFFSIWSMIKVDFRSTQNPFSTMRSSFLNIPEPAVAVAWELQTARNRWPWNQKLNESDSSQAIYRCLARSNGVSAGLRHDIISFLFCAKKKCFRVLTFWFPFQRPTTSWDIYVTQKTGFYFLPLYVPLAQPFMNEREHIYRNQLK